MPPDADHTGWTAHLRQAAKQMQGVGVPRAMADARRLLAHSLNLESGRVTVVLGDQPQARELERFQVLVGKRCARQPVSQLIGKREFYGREFTVTPDVLDPRPDTETLIGAALELPFRNVLDLGTGSGCILLTLLSERPSATGVGVEVSAAAQIVAQKNAQDLGLAARADIRMSDWFSNVQGAFDLIVSNPPYISASEYLGLAPEVKDWEPKQALTPGGDGLDAYRVIARKALDHLNPGGRLIVEIGPSQARSVRSLFVRAGLTNITLYQDIDGRDRVVSGRKPGNNTA